MTITHGSDGRRMVVMNEEQRVAPKSMAALPAGLRGFMTEVAAAGAGAGRRVRRRRRAAALSA